VYRGTSVGPSRLAATTRLVRRRRRREEGRGK